MTDFDDDVDLNGSECVDDCEDCTDCADYDLDEDSDDVSDELDRINREIDVVEKITDNSLDYDSKMKILEKEYAAIDDSYEMKVQTHKHGIKWGKFFEGLKGDK